jgi:hypothetical protein
VLSIATSAIDRHMTILAHNTVSHFPIVYNTDLPTVFMGILGGRGSNAFCRAVLRAVALADTTALSIGQQFTD